MYLSVTRSHLLIAVPSNEKDGTLSRPRLHVIELNNMTPNTIASGAAMGPELN
jgi:hypothetical protein